MTDEKSVIRVITEAGPSSRAVRLFQGIICRHFRLHPRPMPWRRTRNPYRILLSEVMLQQTQVERVLIKYREFTRAFPDLPSLAKAGLADVLRVWQGMGYNRRALLLKKLAGIVMQEHGGKVPLDPVKLLALPGIGSYSASAIYTFATNKPSIFIETNIRRVFIHFFFGDRNDVQDAAIMPLIEMTLDRSNPREWYYALMDYGVKLKKEVPNPNRRSAHYQKQSRFHGSSRQIRGMVLKALLHEPGLTPAALKRRLQSVPDNLEKLLDDLTKEGILQKKGRRFSIAEHP